MEGVLSGGRLLVPHSESPPAALEGSLLSFLDTCTGGDAPSHETY